MMKKTPDIIIVPKPSADFDASMRQLSLLHLRILQRRLREAAFSAEEQKQILSEMLHEF